MLKVAAELDAFGKQPREVKLSAAQELPHEAAKHHRPNVEVTGRKQRKASGPVHRMSRCWVSA